MVGEGARVRILELGDLCLKGRDALDVGERFGLGGGGVGLAGGDIDGCEGLFGVVGEQCFDPSVCDGWDERG